MIEMRSTILTGPRVNGIVKSKPRILRKIKGTQIVWILTLVGCK